MGNNIGCVSIEVYPIGKPLDIECYRLGDIAELSVYPIGKPLTIECFRVCTIPSTFIRFKDNLLSWYGTDNNEGVIKYNILTASGEWSLEEVEVEELL